MTERFSQRYGYGQDTKEIVVQHDAPPELREAVISIAYQTFGNKPSRLRYILCDVLLVRPNRGNWSEYPNIDDEVLLLIETCEWYRVYDIIEAIEKEAREIVWPKGQPTKFATELNRYFVNQGIGWQLSDGEVLARGEDASELTRKIVDESLQDKELVTSRRELREAVRSLSIRPEADVTGAIQHVMAALECLAREVAEEPKLTLGEIIKRNPGMIPPPLDDAVEKVWGYASERGRHLREGRPPRFEEAMFVVSISSAVCMYLSQKLR